MPRLGVKYEDIRFACEQLLETGVKPTGQRIRELLGRGSMNTIHKHLQQWQIQYHEQTKQQMGYSMPERILQMAELLWKTSVEEAAHDFEQQKIYFNAKREELERKVSHLQQVEEILKVKNETCQEKMLFYKGQVERLESDNAKIRREFDTVLLKKG